MIVPVNEGNKAQKSHGSIYEASPHQVSKEKESPGEAVESILNHEVLVTGDCHAPARA